MKPIYLDQPNITIPLAASFNQRGILGNTQVAANVDQIKNNSIYEPITNQMTGTTKFYLCTRPGVDDTGASYGVSGGQVAYFWEVAAGATSNTSSNRWVFSTLGTPAGVRASDTVTTVTLFTSSDCAPAFVDKTQLSGIDEVVFQARHSSGIQRMFHTSTIGGWIEVTSAAITSQSLQGKMEHLDGYGFIATPNRIYNSDLNSLDKWSASGYIARRISQDLGTGLAKLGSQIISFGTATMEVFRNVGNPSGSPLEAVPTMAQDYGLAPTTVTGMRHYYATLANRLYWRGSDPAGIFTYNGQTVEKVSNLAIDKVFAEATVYHVCTLGFSGKRAVVFGINQAGVGAQISYLFFPEWKEWFRWQSNVFLPQTSPRLEDVCVGALNTNGNKLYAIATTTETSTDAGQQFTFQHQFKLPKKGNGRQVIHMLGVQGDTTSSQKVLSVKLSRDDFQTFEAGRAIDMSKHEKRITRCGAIRTPVVVQISYSDVGPLRLENFIARIE